MIDRIDQFVLTVADLEATLGLYERVPGFRRHVEEGRPAALLFGRQTINVHQAARTVEPKAAAPMPGSADVCLGTCGPLAEVEARLAAEGVAVVLGPVARIGALGATRSVYVRDPDANLVEIARYDGGCGRARPHRVSPPVRRFGTGASAATHL